MIITSQQVKVGDFEGVIKVWCETNIWGDTLILYIEGASNYRQGFDLGTSPEVLYEEAELLIEEYVGDLESADLYR